MHRLEQMILLAKELHKDQIRRYTGEKYEIHLAEVAANAVMYYHYVKDLIPLHVYLAIAWWHDSMEDQRKTIYDLHDIAMSCGFAVEEAQQFAFGVFNLSDLDEGNREQRLRLSRERLGQAELWVQLIKCADLDSNTRSIFQKDPDFFSVYSQEKLKVLEALTAIPVEVKQRMVNNLNGLIEQHKSRPICKTSQCGSALIEDTRTVTYINHMEQVRYQNDVRGMFCDCCGSIELLDSRGSEALRMRAARRNLKFGRQLIGLTNNDTHI